MSLEQTSTLLRGLNLNATATAIPEVLARADANELSYLQFAHELVEFETSVSEYVWRVRTVKHHLHSYGKAYSISLSRERRISPSAGSKLDTLQLLGEFST